MASACPAADVWGQAARRLAAAAIARGSPPDTRRRIASLARHHPKAHRDRFLIPALFAPTSATSKHAHNTTNTAMGIFAQSRIGAVRYTG